MSKAFMILQGKLFNVPVEEADNVPYDYRLPKPDNAVL
jgi:hypothetical protein